MTETDTQMSTECRADEMGTKISERGLMKTSEREKE